MSSSRSKSSQRWLQEHFDDPYVQKAKAMGYRSRAAFKLIEIQEKDKICRKGMRVLDLGAAPGGWSQLLVDWVGPKGQVFALDCLEIASLPDLIVIQGDFTEPKTIEALKQALNGQKVDLIVSDMAPNASGIESVDIPKAMFLAELALFLAEEVLVAGGDLLIKIFHGQGLDEFRAQLKQKFKKISTRKPKASRPRSKEAYLLAIGYNL